MHLQHYFFFVVGMERLGLISQSKTRN